MPKRVEKNRIWMSFYIVELYNETGTYLKAEVNKFSGVNHK